MPRPFNDFTQQFFWDFKRMDNVNYNFHIIEMLYEARKREGSDQYINKPIMLLIVAIIECALYDLVKRIHQHRSDSIPNLPRTIIDYFRTTKDSDELKVLIPQLQGQNILRAAEGDSIYADLEHLRIVRNRIHIQNRFNQLHPDEVMVFTDYELRRAQATLERICEILCNVYPRWNRQPIPMIDFPRPWE